MMKHVSMRVSVLAAAALILLAHTAARTAPGDVKASFDIPCNHPSGLASDGTDLYLADWQSATIYVLSPADGTVLRSFAAPTLKPHGLTFGMDHLFISDDHTGFVYALNLGTGIVDYTFQAPGSIATGLAFGNGRLFILERSSKKIYTVIPEDGTILSYIDTPDNAC
jgi:outer membrane protein assembly factor BamB